MYSTVGIIKSSKLSGKIVGTHQKLDRIAHRLLSQQLSPKTFFPTNAEIRHFEGMRGPDGLKRKSPGVDEPQHFIVPGHDDGSLIKIILDHQYNLRQALKRHDSVRAAFEAAWLAHAITDGLTPAHHFPLADAAEELMSDKEFLTVFKEPIKGIMRGDTALETLRNNWRYWGVGGHMTKHIAFEFGVAIIATPLPARALKPKLSPADFHRVNLQTEFYRALTQIDQLKIYDRFLSGRWDFQLTYEVRTVLLPEIIRVIALAWASVIPDKNKLKVQNKRIKQGIKKCK